MSYLVTVCDHIRDAESRLNAAGVVFGHGTDNAFDEACVLLRHTLHLVYDLDLTQYYWQAKLYPQESAAFENLLQRRIKERLPAPYLTGEVHVQGTRIMTDRNVIVPRSFIGEIFQEGALEPWLLGPIVHGLDLCTGSGVIAIQMADTFTCSSIEAVDISPAALNLARQNIALHLLEEVITVVDSDLYTQLDPKQYDLIVSNPPYVNAQSMEHLPLEYQSEPELALAGGIDGMDLVRRILAGASAFLSANGLLVIEIGHEADYFEAAFPTLNFVYLPVTQGDRCVVLVNAQDLKGLNVV